MELFTELLSAYGPAVLAMLFALSLAAGFIDSIAGGGGLLLVPGFLLAGLSPQLALGQEKAVSTFGTLAAIHQFARSKQVQWKLVACGVPFALLGAYIGAKAVLWLPMETVAKVIIFMLPLGIALTFAPKRQQRDTAVATPALWLLAMVCLLIGFYDGFFGPGTGSLLILAFHYLLGQSLVEASASSKLFNLASNIGALVAFVVAGKVLWLLAMPLLLANIAGNYLGSRLALRGGDRVVRVALGSSMTLLLGSLIFKYMV